MTYGTTANRHGGRSKHLGGPVHGMFMEWRNTTKIFLIFGNVFQCLLDEGISKICKKLKSHGGFLSYLQDRTANLANLANSAAIFCPAIVCPQTANRGN